MLVAADVRFGPGVENAWSNFMEAAPKVVAFLVILGVGLLVAKAIGTVMTKLLRKAGFDRFVQRGAIRHAMTRTQYDASQIAGKLTYYAVALLTLVLAFGVFGADNPVSQLLAGIMAFIPKLVVAIAIVLIAAAIASWVKDMVGGALGGLPYGALLATVASGAILVTGIFMAMTQLEIAPAIVSGLFYAILAALVGVTIVAVGGGGIRPMRGRWERALSTMDVEGPRVKEHARQAKAQRAADARERAAQYTQPYAGPPFPADKPPQQQPVQQQAQQYAAGAGERAGAVPMPPAAYGEPPRMTPGGFPAEPTIDLTREELQRQGVRGGYGAPPRDEPGVPPGPRP